MGTPSELVVKDRRRFDADGERRPEVEPFVADPADDPAPAEPIPVATVPGARPAMAAQIAAMLATVGGDTLDRAIADAVATGGDHEQISARVANAMAEAMPVQLHPQSRETRRRLRQLRAGQLRGVALDTDAHKVQDMGTLERLAAERARIFAAEDVGEP